MQWAAKRKRDDEARQAEKVQCKEEKYLSVGVCVITESGC